VLYLCNKKFLTITRKGGTYTLPAGGTVGSMKKWYSVEIIVRVGRGSTFPVIADPQPPKGNGFYGVFFCGTFLICGNLCSSAVESAKWRQ